MITGVVYYTRDLQGLQSTGNEGQQLTAVIEMCQVSDHRGCVLYKRFTGSSIYRERGTTADCCHRNVSGK